MNNAFAEGMFDTTALYAMMPSIDYNAWKNMLPSADVAPLNTLMMKMTETLGDTTQLVRTQVESMLGLKIPENANTDELGQAFALQFMMKAATQIPLEIFDPLAAYKAQAAFASSGN